MEIGLDYMHMRSRAQHYGLRWTGIAILLVGMGLALSGGIYYGYIFWLRAELGDYAAQRQDVAVIENVGAQSNAAEGVTVAALTLPAGAYPEQIEQLGFIPMQSDAAAALGTQLPATRLSIPSLGIDAKSAALRVTGASVVNYASGINPSGQLATSANPGERGAMWFFGPAGKGSNSFGGLTKAPELLVDGEDVLLVVGNGSQEYLYLGTHTDVIHSSALQLSSTDRATVHLVVPVPTGLYDHFLVLSGELVGMR